MPTLIAEGAIASTKPLYQPPPGAEIAGPSAQPAAKKRTSFVLLFFIVFFAALLVGAGAFAVYHFVVVKRAYSGPAF
jgi:hypothetical protein